MKTNLLALILATAFIGPAIAEKPEWAGKGKPTDAQKSAHQAVMKAKGDLDEGVKKEKSNNLKGLEKQKAMKSEQIRKELDKGADKGKESRESNSKKWWNFWGE